VRRQHGDQTDPVDGPAVRHHQGLRASLAYAPSRRTFSCELAVARKSLQELIKYIKDNAGKITYGTTGDGSPQQLATLLFVQTAGGLGKMTEVPYKGSSPRIPT